MTSSAPALDSSIAPDVSALVTEDDSPVDNLYSEKQQRLLTSALYTSWHGPPPEDGTTPRKFLAMANVGLFVSVHEPPLVPDVMVSLDVVAHPEIWQKAHRSYFSWEFGKLPEVVIEVVSNREADELGAKRRRYAHMRVLHYVVWDPEHFLSAKSLSSFELRGHIYGVMRKVFFEPLQLGLTVWHGVFEGLEADWLRWCDANDQLLPTPEERVRQESERALGAERRAQGAEELAQRLAERLRALGIDPSSV
jgi:Uma2 family endonuclease